MTEDKVKVGEREIEIAVEECPPLARPRPPLSVEAGGKISGTLTTVEKPQGIIIFAHGSGSDRFSPRNKYVAEVLQDKGFTTLLFDLLTEREAEIDMQTHELRFDIDLLTARLLLATKWCKKDNDTRRLPIGYFGASTGAAAALFAAAELGSEIIAVVSRGGRTDMAIEKSREGRLAALPLVRAPTLLIVGGNDQVVIDMNKRAAKYLKVKKELLIIPGADHLFEEPGTLEKVAQTAAEWFESYLMK